ncbi:MAG: prepilin-type N-terminal cleavage/methylation domain-containing protein [Cyanobacteriota bacterium]|nr:prepilin-type N-terminal cleavage/methylation domain-containing protein [Cyanobacteriota bacterium]
MLCRLSPKAFFSGFTLIEVMTILVIVGILASVGIPSGINFYNRNNLDTAHSKLYGALRTARSNARASLQGRSWQVELVTQGDDLVAVVEDVDGLCNEPTPCQSIRLGNYVELVEATFANGTNGSGIAEFNTEGEAIGTGGFNTGTFSIESKYSGDRRCVIVSTILGAMRKASDAGCS